MRALSFYNKMLYCGLESADLQPCCERRLDDRMSDCVVHFFPEEGQRGPKEPRSRWLKRIRRTFEEPTSSLVAQLLASVSMLFVVISMVTLCASTLPDWKNPESLEQHRGQHSAVAPSRLPEAKKKNILFLPDAAEEALLSRMYYYRYESAEVSCCYKYLMFSYNIIFWLAGVAFIAVGFWAWSEKGVLLDLTQVTRLHGFDPVWLVLVVGAVTFILGFAGCVGALRENICLLKFFSGVIGFIFVLELAAAVLAVVFQSQVREWINDFFLSSVRGYRDDIDLQNLIDSLQRMNHCCGAQDPNDWDLNVYFSCNGTHLSREKCGVPFSCCITDPADSVLNTQCGYDVRKPKMEWTDHIYTKGCIAALEDWLPRNLYPVAIVFIVISLLQMVGIYLARTLISDIQKVNFSY